MTSVPLVSVIVLCHEQSKFLAEALASVRAQTYPRVEVAIATGDGESERAALDYLCTTTLEGVWDPIEGTSFRVLPNLVQGRADAFNRAVQASSGKYVIRLDADDKLDPQAIEKLVVCAEAASGPIIVTSNFQEFGGGDRFYDIGGKLTTSVSDMANGNRIHCTSLFSRELWERTGGYERALFGHEDWDFWVKCAKHSPVVGKVSEVLFYYRIHPESSSDFCYRHDSVLRAAIRLLNFPDEAGPDDELVFTNAPEEVKDKFRERARWFPDYAPAVHLAELVDRPLPKETAELLPVTLTGDLITVSMILKDEAHCIRSTIDSCRGYVDRWVVLDTGSTDGTQELLRQELGGALELYEEPFVDFSTSRNRALDLCGEKTEYILMLSADEEVTRPDRLWHFLSTRRRQRGLSDEAYRVLIEFPGSVYDSNRVIRSRAPWRYTGVTHEVIVRPGGNPEVPRVLGSTIIHHADSSPNAEVNKKRRYERDVELLEAELERDPTSSRTLFYLGCSYLWTGRNVEAIRTFKRRIDLGGWKEEVFAAKLLSARAACHLGLSWERCVSLYLEAHSYDPTRAEPLADIAKGYGERGDRAAAVVFARRAFEIPEPTGGMALFLERAVYTWLAADILAHHAYYTPGCESIGLEAAKHAWEHGPPEQREHLARNLAVSLERAGKAGLLLKRELESGKSGEKRALSSRHLRALRTSS
jgi:glycosyltransferase involved in cell wall biosynthesis